MSSLGTRLSSPNVAQIYKDVACAVDPGRLKERENWPNRGVFSTARVGQVEERLERLEVMAVVHSQSRWHLCRDAFSDSVRI